MTGGQGNRLAGKRVLVTGASSGIGAAAARLFAAEGARLVLLARRREALEALASELGEDRALPVTADLTVPDQVAAAVERAWGWLGGLEALVNCAGIARPTPLQNLTPETWRTTIDVNLNGAFYVSREVGLRMAAADGGTIVNIGSELGATLGMATNIAYCASKAGIIGLTKALAAELAPKVTANAVCPGPVDTPMLDAALKEYCALYAVADPEEARAATVDRVPLKRLATPEDVALAILYLVADARFATGATLELDGGTTAVVR